MATSSAQSALDNSPWKEYDDEESGNKYYYNVDSQETTWEMPVEYKVIGLCVSLTLHPKVLLDRLSTEIKQSILNSEAKTVTTTAPQMMELKTKEEAEECFIEMLQEFDVGPSWYT